jgi:predicted DNA-binding transcriptional regulator AlpA
MLDFVMTRNNGNVLNVERQFVSERELEQITGINRRTLQKHRLFGKGPRFYRLGGAVRYKLSEVMEWIEANAVGGSAR